MESDHEFNDSIMEDVDTTEAKATEVAMADLSITTKVGEKRTSPMHLRSSDRKRAQTKSPDESDMRRAKTRKHESIAEPRQIIEIPRSNKDKEDIQGSKLSEDNENRREATRPPSNLLLNEIREAPQSRTVTLAELPPVDGMRRRAVCSDNYNYTPRQSIDRVEDFTEISEESRKILKESELKLIRECKLLELYDIDVLQTLWNKKILENYGDPMQYYSENAPIMLKRYEDPRKFNRRTDGFNEGRYHDEFWQRVYKELTINPNEVCYRGYHGMQRVEALLNKNGKNSYLETDLKKRFYNLQIPPFWKEKVLESADMRTEEQKQRDIYKELLSENPDWVMRYEAKALEGTEAQEKFLTEGINLIKIQDSYIYESIIIDPKELLSEDEKSKKGDSERDYGEGPIDDEYRDQPSLRKKSVSYESLEGLTSEEDKETKEAKAPKFMDDSLKAAKAANTTKESNKVSKTSKGGVKDQKKSVSNKKDDDPSDSDSDKPSSSSSSDSSEDEDEEMKDPVKKMKTLARHEELAKSRDETFITALTGVEDALGVHISELQDREEFVEPPCNDTTSSKGPDGITVELKFYQLTDTKPTTIRSFLYYHFDCYQKIQDQYDVAISLAHEEDRKKKRKKLIRNAENKKIAFLTTLTNYSQRLSPKVQSEIKTLIGKGPSARVTKFEVWEYILGKVRAEHTNNNYSINDFIAYIKGIRQSRWKKTTDEKGPKISFVQILEEYYPQFENFVRRMAMYNSELEEEIYSRIFLAGIYWTPLRKQSILWISEAIKKGVTVEENSKRTPVTMQDRKTIFLHLKICYIIHLDIHLNRENSVTPAALMDKVEENFESPFLTMDYRNISDFVHPEKAKAPKEKPSKERPRDKFKKPKVETKGRKEREEKQKDNKRKRNKKDKEDSSVNSDESEKKEKKSQPKGSGKPCIICKKEGHKSNDCKENCFCGWKIVLPTKEEMKNESCVKHSPFECHANEYNIDTYKGRRHNDDGKCPICSDKSQDELRKYLKEYRKRKFFAAGKKAANPKNEGSKDKKSKDKKGKK